MRDIAERKAIERMQQDFLAVTTHELRSPVTGIKGNAQIMQRRGRYSERSVEAIIAQAERLQRLIDDLMLASQIQADHLTLALEETDLVAAARRAVTHLGIGDSSVRVDAPEEPLVVLADQNYLSQVLTNLLTNAVKYSPEGGDVTVRFTRQGAEAHVAVIDRGVGISPTDIPHLFDRFYRVRDTATRVPGLGLGLYICQRIVEAHGGRIDVESKPGLGSTFTVVLPIKTHADQQPE
jgi:signal transduction histidine kinase